MHDPSDSDERFFAEVEDYLAREADPAGPDLPLDAERALWREVSQTLGLPLRCTRRDCRRARRCIGAMGAVERGPHCLIGEDDDELEHRFAEARELRAARLRRARAR
jgi:hypothetical protein